MNNILSFKSTVSTHKQSHSATIMLLTMNAIIKYVLLHDKDLVEFQDID